MIEVQKLDAGYSNKTVLKNVSFCVQKGKIVTLIGPNGSGKSTILKTLTRQIAPLSGSISVFENDFKKMKDKEISKKISMVMTEKIHPENMTCKEVVATGRFPYTGKFGILNDEDWKFVEDAMNTVKIREIENLNFSRISDGQKQLVMLARCICQNTDIIILDEPTTFLDLHYKLEFLKILKKLARQQNKAILMSLHELDLVKMIADFVLCVDGKKLVKQGTVEEIFSGSFIQKLYNLESAEFDEETGRILLGKDEPSSPLHLHSDTTLRSSQNQVLQTESGCRDLESATTSTSATTSAAGTTSTSDTTSGAGIGSSSDTISGAAGKKAKVLMIQGTMSNAGKSLLVAGLCRIFTKDGYRVAPFKSQNMALNSFITKDGLEMGRAQVLQAQACKKDPDVKMNPVLLKPVNDTGSQVIVMGKPVCNMKAKDYFEYKTQLIPVILNAFNELSKTNDIIVIEGAGSPAEINLRKNDIVNMGLAELVDSPVLLVGDIDRGGVFAQLLGTINLLEEKEKNRIKGLIINKFRGDSSLLDSGIQILEEKCGIPVTGLIPYLNVAFDDEDSLSSCFEKKDFNLVNIGVIRLPHISNFTDFNVFEQMEEVTVHYLTSPENISKMDFLIIPGTKNTISDLSWLKEKGFEKEILEFAEKGNPVFGICGGFQMLGLKIQDPEGVEEGGEISGLGLLPLETVLKKEKVTKQVSGTIGKLKGAFSGLSGRNYKGYEIHMGISKNAENEDCAPVENKGSIYGSYVHGLFDSDSIAELMVQAAAKKKGLNLRGKTINPDEYREKQFDILEEALRKNLDLKSIYAILEGQKNG